MNSFSRKEWFYELQSNIPKSSMLAYRFGFHMYYWEMMEYMRREKLMQWIKMERSFSLLIRKQAEII